MQGVIKVYDPTTRLGVVVCDTDLNEYELAPGALDGSIFRMLRQGQRIVFDLDERGLAAQVRIGAEVDMGTPGFPTDDPQLALEDPATTPAGAGPDPS